MNTFMSICLEKNGEIPIYKQLGGALLGLISEGVLEPDSRLPPIRKMAESLKINSSTVVSAYKYLESKHAVYSFLGSGTYVAPYNKKNQIVSPEYKKPAPFGVAETKIVTDFTSAFPPAAMFPVNEIKDAFNTAIDRELGDFFSSSGIENTVQHLKEIINGALKRDGISVYESSLFITEGINKAVEMISEILINKGDYVILEKPVSYARAGAYAERGANILQAPLRAYGIELNSLEALLKLYRPKVAHFSTYYQVPTNVCYSIDNKKAALDLCYKYGAAIVEEDAYSDLYDNAKKVLIKSLDYRSRVIYVKSITKTVLPWFNACFCVFPRKYQLNTDKQLHSITNVPQMKILRELLASGVYGNITNKIVHNHQKAYNNTAEIINGNLSDFIEFDRQHTGMGFWLKVKKGGSTLLAQKCALRGVMITPGSIYLNGASDCFRLCTSSLTKEEVYSGIKVLNEELTKLRPNDIV